MGEQMTVEQFRAEFATEAGRRRLGYAPGQERQDRVDRIVADDLHFQQIYQQWLGRQVKVRAVQKRERRAAWGRVGIVLFLAGIGLMVTGANLIADHVQSVSDGPCRERWSVATLQTTTVCPTRMEPIRDGYRAAWSFLGWGVGGGMAVTGVVLIARHPRL